YRALFWTTQISSGHLLVSQFLGKSTSHLVSGLLPLHIVDRLWLELTRLSFRKGESRSLSFEASVCPTSGSIIFPRWSATPSSSFPVLSATAPKTNRSLFVCMTACSTREYDAGWTKSNCCPVTTYRES